MTYPFPPVHIVAETRDRGGHTRLMIRLAAPLAMLILLSQPALVWGQEPPELVTDRPDFTESSEVVERGAVQIETGFTLESNVSEGEELRGITVPAVLARIGLGHRVEVRFGGDGICAPGRRGHHRRPCPAIRTSR